MLAYLFLAVAIALRFLQVPVAFTSVGAALLFFGARMPRKQLWIPVVLLIGADVALTTLVYGYAIPADHLVTWAWYAAIGLLGGTLRGEPKPLRIGGTALASSVSFFLVSNFAVWAVWSMYPKTLDGLMAAYVAGLPFFRQSVAADLFFTAVFFSVPVVLESLIRGLRRGEHENIAAA